jgi:hypothetical protein
MKKKVNLLILPILFIWELPQNILGLLMHAIMKSRQKISNTETEGHHVFIETANTGVSLGWFIFWTSTGNRFPYLKNDCRMHEYGHSKQSSMLGPVYLLVVGIPSVARVIYRKWYYKKYGINWENYYASFPEDWADNLGGVTFPKIIDS